MASFRKTPKINVGEFPYADIMPASRKRAIESQVTKKKWIKIVGGGVIVAIVLSAGAFGFKVFTQLSYDSAVANKQTVEDQINANAEADNALTIFDSRSSSIEAASASQLRWSELLTKLEEVKPAGSSFKTVQIMPGGSASDEAAVAIVVDLQSTEPLGYSESYDSFSRMPGLVDGQIAIGNLTSGITGDSAENTATAYSYSIGLLIDGSYLKYVPEEEAVADTSADDASGEDN
jgi:hypothetical protein